MESNVYPDAEKVKESNKVLGVTPPLGTKTGALKREAKVEFTPKGSVLIL
jgi:hypothetical protein